MKPWIVAAAFALIAMPALAEDAANDRIQVRIPNGWIAEQMKNDKMSAVALISPDYNRTGASCLLASGTDPNSVGQSQQELNATAEAITTEAFWKDLFSLPGIKNIKIIETGKKTRAGRSVPFVKASYDEPDEGPLMAKDALQLVPGSMLIVDCTAKATAFREVEASFDVVIDSFGPLGGDVVASLPRANGQVAFIKTAPSSGNLKALVAEAHIQLRNKR